MTIVRKDRPSLQLDILTKAKNLIGVEIGIEYGYNALGILDLLDIKTLYLVDPYKPFPSASCSVVVSQDYQNDAKKQAHENLKKYKDKIVWIEKFSQDAAKDIPNNLDFVYIDGDHREESVRKDILAYFPKIKNNGLICGHDYNKKYVTTAVNKIFGSLVTQGNMDWWVYKEAALRELADALLGD